MFKVFINKIIRTLILSDIFFFSAFGLIGPIFAVFITDQIAGATIVTVGFATTINLFTRSILSLPIARYIDCKSGEKDDFSFMVIGMTLISIVPFAYLFVSAPLHLYIVQFILGVGGAFANPGWYAIFTRHIDRTKESTEWTFENVGVGLASSGAAAMGGIIAKQFGFNNLFLIVGVLSVLGLIINVSLYNTIIASDHHDHKNHIDIDIGGQHNL